jgi:hypothetical protein
MYACLPNNFDQYTDLNRGTYLDITIWTNGSADVLGVGANTSSNEDADFDTVNASLQHANQSLEHKAVAGEVNDVIAVLIKNQSNPSYSTYAIRAATPLKTPMDVDTSPASGPPHSTPGVATFTLDSWEAEFPVPTSFVSFS